MKCEYCENEVSGGISSCPFCGAAIMSVANNASSKNMDHLQNAEQLQQSQCDGNINKDFLSQQLEHGKAQLEQLLRPANINNTNKSPYKRIIFLFLGIFLCFWGIQFLYARRFISFAAILICFIASMIFRNSSVQIAQLESLVVIASFIASFVIETDGKQRKMAWF